MIYEKLMDDLKQAMLQKEELKVSTLRMLKAELMKYEKEAVGQAVTDEVALNMVQRLVKQRKDSAEQFKNGGRPELAEKEEQEIAILMTYMPAQMGEDEVRAIVKSKKEALGVTDKSGVGKLMGALMGELKGKADGALIKRVVDEELS
ncbi:MAG: GatB/YqeY domain-containing protein [Patescibacteria group bacterium]